MNERVKALVKVKAVAARAVDASVFFKLARVVNLTARPFTAELGRARTLSLNEWRVLLVLHGHPGVAAADVAALCGLDKMSVSRAVASLDRHRRLHKQRDDGDARRTCLWLNAAGEKLMAELLPQAQARERMLLACLGAAQQRQLGAWLDRLAEQVLKVDAEGMG